MLIKYKIRSINIFSGLSNLWVLIGRVTFIIDFCDPFSYFFKAASKNVEGSWQLKNTLDYIIFLGPLPKTIKNNFIKKLDIYTTIIYPQVSQKSLRGFFSHDIDSNQISCLALDCYGYLVYLNLETFSLVLLLLFCFVFHDLTAILFVYFLFWRVQAICLIECSTFCICCILGLHKYIQVKCV